MSLNRLDGISNDLSVESVMNWRREIKFYISAEKIENLRMLLSQALSPDPNMVDGSYSVNSVYYDTPDWEFYAAKKAGYQKRLKVRIRSYGDPMTTDMAVLEVKNRANNFVWKDRLWGEYGELTDFATSSISSKHLLKSGQETDNIFRVVKARTLQPKVLVKYNRASYFSAVNSDLRVTLDTQLVTGAMSAVERRFLPDARDLLRGGAILEIKFSGSYPNWLEKVLRAFQPDLVSFSKYVEAIHYLMKTKPANVSLADQAVTQDGLLWFRHRAW